MVQGSPTIMDLNPKPEVDSCGKLTCVEQQCTHGDGFDTSLSRQSPYLQVNKPSSKACHLSCFSEARVMIHRRKYFQSPLNIFDALLVVAQTGIGWWWGSGLPHSSGVAKNHDLKHISKTQQDSVRTVAKVAALFLDAEMLTALNTVVASCRDVD